MSTDTTTPDPTSPFEPAITSTAPSNPPSPMTGAVSSRSAAVASDLRLFAHSSHAWGMHQPLSDLAEAIDTGLDAHLWAEVNLFDAFGGAELVSPPLAPSRLQRTLMAAPAVLVFLPIVVTWTGLVLATNAYRAALSGDPTLVGRSFLELWQSGFAGHLSPWFAFDRAAMMTLTALVILVASVIGATMARRAYAEASEAHEVSLQQRLHSLLIRASLALAEERLTSPDRLVLELNKAAQEVRELHDQAKRLQASAARSTTTAAGAIESAIISSQSIEEATRALDGSLSEIAIQIVALRPTLASLSAEVSQIPDRVTMGVSEGLSPMAESNQRLSEATNAFQRTAARALTEARDTVGSQQQVVNAATQRLQVAVSDAERDFANSVDRLTSSLQGQASGYESAVDAAGRVAERTSDLSAALESVLRRLGEHLADLDRRQAAVDSRMERDSRAQPTLTPPRSNR